MTAGRPTGSPASWVLVLAAMEREWCEAEDSERALVTAWEPEMAALSAEEDGLRGKGHWVHGRYDYLGVLGLERAEIRHSRMLGWLLDPCAHHGLGVRVLKGVLDATFGSELDPGVYSALGNGRVACEVGRDDCQIDIFVTAPGLTLVIENKVDADEGDRQCDSYFDLFRHEPGARFVFLTPTGRTPCSASGAALEEWRSLSYPTIRRILRAALADAPPAARGRTIAADYLRTLELEF